MLRDLTIQNYRCFKDFHVDGLARVNLIVGANNSGKTKGARQIPVSLESMKPGDPLPVRQRELVGNGTRQCRAHPTCF